MNVSILEIFYFGKIGEFLETEGLNSIIMKQSGK